MGYLADLFQDVDEGYLGLERHAQGLARRTISEHPELVRLWCELLTLYTEGLRGTHALEDSDENNRIAKTVRMQFFAIGVSHSKSALDAILMSHYHLAFFSIRYLAELLIQSMYVRARPCEARRWYKNHADSNTSAFPPTFVKAFNHVRKVTPHKPSVESVYEIAKEMDNHGAHPSREVLTWTRTSVCSSDIMTIGPTYSRGMCLGAADRGLFMTLALLQEMSDEVSPAEDEWQARLDAYWKARVRVMELYESQ